MVPSKCICQIMLVKKFHQVHAQPNCGKNTSLEMKKGKGISNYFMTRTTLESRPTIKSELQSKEAIESCDIAISKWMIDAFIPFNAVNAFSLFLAYDC